MPKNDKPIVWQELDHDIDNAVRLIKVEEHGVWRSTRRKKKTSTILNEKLQQEEDDKPAIIGTNMKTTTLRKVKIDIPARTPKASYEETSDQEY